MGLESPKLWDTSALLSTRFWTHYPTLIAINPRRGREAVAELQPLCERVPRHTDGKGTRQAWSRWWHLLAAADPVALGRLVQRRLLKSCNDPNPVLHGARSDLWRAWHRRADPLVAAALRLTLDIPLEDTDVAAFPSLAANLETTGDARLSRLLVALLARFDERPFKYSVSNSSDLLEHDHERVCALNAVAERANTPRITALPRPPTEKEDLNTPPIQKKTPQSTPYLPERNAPMFRPGAAGIADAIRGWRQRRYDETRPGWSVERFATCVGYRLVELLDRGQNRDAKAALGLITDMRSFDDSPALLKALGEGLERHHRGPLATIAYTLAWTRARGGGGWLTFGGETEVDSLRQAVKLDRALVLETIANEIERVVSRGDATTGIGQALIYGFARGGLHTDSSIAFDIWKEMFAVISDRAPRVADADDPEDIYHAPDPDCDEDLPGDLDVAFAAATVAALAHPGREQKRRSLLATDVLITERPSTVATVIGPALLSLSDSATVTWLLRVMELRREEAAPLVFQCRNVLTELCQRPHLTVRALARRLISNDDVLPIAPRELDPELLERTPASFLLSAGTNSAPPNSSASNDLVEWVAGIRLARAEQLLPGLTRAVLRRVDEARKEDAHRHRMDVQRRAYADKSRKRLPDAFLASVEAVEEAIQRAAAGARGARLMNGQLAADPLALEESLAQALLNDPEFPLAVERTRQSRPEIPRPPGRGDSLWSHMRARAADDSVEATGVEAANHTGDELRGTVAILAPRIVPTVVGGPYDKWRLVATVERRVVPSRNWRADDDIAVRHRAIELRVTGDREALDLTPIAPADIALWSASSALERSACRGRTQAVVGCDYSVPTAGDGRHGVGIQRQLLTPSPWLIAALGLNPTDYFTLDDDRGPAAALISWRTEYETNDYYLTWPRLCGTGLVVRSDAFDLLVHLAPGGLVYRDFLAGSSNLCAVRE